MSPEGLEKNQALLESCATESTAASETSPTSIASSPVLYHERQVGRLCGMHCVNNILQRRAYEPFDFQRWEAQIEDQEAALTWWSFPHLFRCFCATVGGADFSVGSVELALADAGLELQWFDRRRKLCELKLDDPCLVGIIVNLQDKKKSCFEDDSDRHWLSVLRTDGKDFYNLDSRLSRPSLLGEAEATISWLQGALANEGSLVFRVRSPVPNRAAAVLPQFEDM